MAKKGRPAFTPDQLEQLRRVYEPQLLMAASMLAAASDCEAEEAAEQACDLMEAVLEYLSHATIEE